MKTSIPMPTKAPLLSGRGWSAWLAALAILCALVPLLNLVIPVGSIFHMSDFAVGLIAKIMCYAICALAMDLIWGYTGILSLGHGLFFALGGYAIHDATTPAVLADASELAGMLAHWERALVSIGFLDPLAPKKLMPRLNQLFNRAGVTQEEIHIPRGIAKMMDKP